MPRPSAQPVVVLVEDLVLVRMMAHDLLEDAGFHVIDTVDAEEALKVLSARPDVMAVVTDVELGSGMNGVELARQISQLWPNVGVIVTSGRAMVAADDLPPGCVFLAKPYPMSALIEQTEAMVRRACAVTVAKPDAEPDAANVVPLRSKDAG
jgi:FixJ family two-component response regulator